MSRPIIYQAMPIKSRLTDLVSNDARVAYLFASTYSLSLGPFEIFQDKTTALNLCHDLASDSPIFPTIDDIDQTVDILFKEVRDTMLIAPNLLRQRILCQFTFEIESFIKRFLTSTHLDESTLLLSHLLFGEFDFTPNGITGSDGDPLRSVSENTVSSASKLFDLLAKYGFFISHVLYSNEYDKLKSIYSNAYENNEVIVIGN